MIQYLLNSCVSCQPVCTKELYAWLPFLIALHMSVHGDSNIDRLSFTGEDGTELKLTNQWKCFGKSNRNIVHRSCLVMGSPVSILNQKMWFTFGPGSRLFFSKLYIHYLFSGIATVTLQIAFLKAESCAMLPPKQQHLKSPSWVVQQWFRYFHRSRCFTSQHTLIKR